MHKKISVKDLPFTEAVIDNITVEDGYMKFKVVSVNDEGSLYKIVEPKNIKWKRSDAYTRNAPLAVKVELYDGLWMGEKRVYGRLIPNYEEIS